MGRGRQAAVGMALGVLLSGAGARGATVEDGSVRFDWAAASGPVTQYGVWVTRNGAESEGPAQFVSDPGVSIGGTPGDQVSIRTAAFDAAGQQGPFSAASEVVLFVEATPPPPIPPPDPDPPPEEEPLPEEPAPEEPPATPPAFDFDGDGVRDLGWFDPIRRRQIVWLMRAGEPAEILESGRSTLPEAWAHTSTADLDGDGVGDLVWSNPLDGAALVQPMAEGVAGEAVILAFPGAGWAALGLGNEPAPDGRARVLWLHVESGEARLWRGAMPDDPAAAETPLTVEAGLAPQVACDVDGDGLRDAVLGDGERLVALRPDGGDPWQAELETGERVRGCGDLDGDGRASVVVQAGQLGSLRILDWSDDGVVSALAVAPASSREVVAVGDFDGNGVAELALRRFDRVYVADPGRLTQDGGRRLDERVRRRLRPLSGAWPAP